MEELIFYLISNVFEVYFDCFFFCFFGNMVEKMIHVIDDPTSQLGYADTNKSFNVLVFCGLSLNGKRNVAGWVYARDSLLSQAPIPIKH